MTKKLLTETFTIDLGKLSLVEDNNGATKVILAKGQFGKADAPTANQRIYPRPLWEREIAKLKPKMEKNEVYGELDHPGDGVTKLQRVSHLVKNAEIEPDGTINGEAIVMPDTRNGKQLMAILNNGGRVGISSRGYGSVVQNTEGVDVVQDDFQLMTWDFVADPASSGSFPEFTTKSEGKKPEIKILKMEENMPDKDIKNNISESSKNREWGFYGTSKTNFDLKNSEADRLFNFAEKSILKKVGGLDKDMATNFLDSSYGRHLADTISNNIKLKNPSLDDIEKAFDEIVKSDFNSIGFNKFTRENKKENVNPNIKTEALVADKKDIEVKKEAEKEPEAKADEKVEALVQKIRKEESDKAVAMLTKMFESKHEELKESIRGELMSDPQIAGARLALENVKKQLRPYIVSEDINEEIGTREKQIESLKQDLSLKEAELNEYAQVTKELGYKLRIEQVISDHQNKKEIRSMMGDVTRFESLAQLEAKLKEALSVVHEKDQKLSELFKARFEEKNKKIESYESEIELLKTEQKKLTKALEESVGLANKYGVKFYTEQVTSGHPAAARIRKIVEAKGLTAKEDVDALVEQFNSFKSSGASLRDKIKSRFTVEDVRPKTLVEDQMKSTMPQTKSKEVIPGTGLTEGDFKVLSGLERSDI